MRILRPATPPAGALAGRAPWSRPGDSARCSQAPALWVGGLRSLLRALPLTHSRDLRCPEQCRGRVLQGASAAWLRGRLSWKLWESLAGSGEAPAQKEAGVLPVATSLRPNPWAPGDPAWGQGRGTWRRRRADEEPESGSLSFPPGQSMSRPCEALQGWALGPAGRRSLGVAEPGGPVNPDPPPRASCCPAFPWGHGCGDVAWAEAHIPSAHPLPWRGGWGEQGFGHGGLPMLGPGSTVLLGDWWLGTWTVGTKEEAGHAGTDTSSRVKASF